MNDYDIAAAFAAIEDELIASMMRNLKRHKAEEAKEGFEWAMWQVEQLRWLEQYKRQNRKKYKSRFRDINARLEEMIREARRQGGMEQEEEILRAIQRGFQTLSDGRVEGNFFRLNDRKLEALIKAVNADMEKAEIAILRRANDEYRKIIFNAQVYANSGAGTYEKAVDMATKDFLSRGIQCVVYANGARHTLRDYADMAIRTASKRAYLQGEGEMRQKWGISTVILNKRGNPCPQCAPFCGKVFIDDVWSGGEAYINGKQRNRAPTTGLEPKTGKQYPLLSAAIAAGLYHPRCKDSHTTFFPGINEEGSPWTAQERSQLEDAYRKGQRQSHARRQAERFERLAKYALDEENRRKYQARADEWTILAEDSKPSYKYPETVISPEIKTPEYRRKLDMLGESTEVSRSLWKNAVRMLAHRSGTKYEDLAFVDAETGKALIQREYNVENQVLPTKAMKQMVNDSNPYSIIAVHNHPGSSVPSIADLHTALKQRYKYGLIVCHNGMVFRYKVAKEFNIFCVDMALDRLNEALYNKNKPIDDILNGLRRQGVELEVVE